MKRKTSLIVWGAVLLLAAYGIPTVPVRLAVTPVDVGDMASDMAGALKLSETKSFEAIQGKAGTREVVDAVMNAELSQQLVRHHQQFDIGSASAGGIVAVVPGRFSVCVWSPELNAAGNSLAGMAALELLSERIGWSVFSPLNR